MRHCNCMKALVTGLVLIAISGAALIWHLATRNRTPAPISRPAGPVRTTQCMVWKAERGQATVWLCGSIHALREEDYPLPQPYLNAFKEASILVTESPHDAAGAAERREKTVAAGLLPAGDTLEKHLSAPVWEQLKAACAELEMNPAAMQSMEPWQAALHLTNYAMQKLGYKPALGMESRFVNEAGSRTLAALETQESQIQSLDTLDAATQEKIVQLAAADVKNAKERTLAYSDALHEGDLRKIIALTDSDLTELPVLKKALLDDRHAAWLPQLEKYLDGKETVMVLVGARHLCGHGSLVELLEARGVKLTQMEHQTTRLAP